MTTKKKLLIKRIAGFDIESKKLKLSRLYIMKLTRDDRVIFKFGKAMNIENRFKAIQKDLDLSDHLQDALNSLKIAFACDESVKTGKVVKV